MLLEMGIGLAYLHTPNTPNTPYARSERVHKEAIETLMDDTDGKTVQFDKVLSEYISGRGRF